MSAGRKLRDVADATVGYVGKMTPHYRDDGVTFLRSQDIRPHRIDATSALKVDPAFEATIQKSRLRTGDVVVVRTGKPGVSAVVPPELEGANCSDLVVIRPGSDLDSRWLSYYINAAAQGFVRARLVGAVQQHFNVKSALEMPLLDIARGVQASQSEVLGALDDKIAANREASRWIDEYLAGAFERELTSAIQVRLGDVAEVNAESVKPAGEGWIKYVDISTLKEGELLTPTRIPWPEAPGRARRALHSGDTLWSTVRPNRRSHALMLGSAEELVASTGIAVITPRRCRASELYEATRRASFQEYLESVAEGSTYPAVRADRFSDAAIDLLQGDGRERFAAVGEPLRMLQWSLREESEHLATTRDELLPLLMSGKITVKDAEKTVEEVV